MPNIDPCRNAREALQRDFKHLQARGTIKRKQVFSPVCVSRATKKNPFRYRMFCLGPDKRRRLSLLFVDYIQTITSSQVPEVVRRAGRWVLK